MDSLLCKYSPKKHVELNVIIDLISPQRKEMPSIITDEWLNGKVRSWS